MDKAQRDDLGNIDVNFDEIVDTMVDTPSSDGKEYNDGPKEEEQQKSPEKSEAKEPEDAEEAILRQLAEEEAGDAGDPDAEPETEEGKAKEEAEQADWEQLEETWKVDGEEVTKTVREWAEEGKKMHGLQSSLTQKGQANAEERKRLEAEAEAIAWVKASPERKQLQQRIAKANEALQRGYILGDDGQPVYLTEENVANTKKNIEDAISAFNELQAPPKLETLQEKVPVLFGDDENARNAKLDGYRDVLSEFGYSQPEITTMDDPRIFLMLEELQGNRDLANRFEAAKARRVQKDPAIASNTTKPVEGKAKPPTGSSQDNKPKKSSKEILAGVDTGEHQVSDMFMEDT